MPNVARKEGKKNRKYGRNEASCKAYKNKGKRETNKTNRIARIEKGFRKNKKKPIEKIKEQVRARYGW